MTVTTGSRGERVRRLPEPVMRIWILRRRSDGKSLRWTSAAANSQC
jgi:hypothetical protein